MPKEMLRTRQCKKCPWKKSVNPRDIPNGYCEIKHKNLDSTIAKPGDLNLGSIRMMACHESSRPGGEYPCVGWVINQLGPGNNIALRLLARDGRFKDLRTVGPQHERFEDTLPKDKE